MIKEEQFQNKYMIKDLESITIEKIYILYFQIKFVINYHLIQTMKRENY